MDIQNIIVFIVASAAALWLIHYLYKSFRAGNCDDCYTGECKAVDVDKIEKEVRESGITGE